MSFASHCIRFIALLLTVLLVACGGGSGAPAPAGGLTVVAGGGQVTVSWQQDPSVQYWLLYGQQSTALDMSNPPGASPGALNNPTVGSNPYTFVCGTASSAGVPSAGQHLWITPINSPCVITGLTEGLTYAFALNGRSNGGPGGPQTPTAYATPRPADANWTLGAGLGSNALYGTSYGAANNGTSDYVAVGSGSSIYHSLDALNWTQVTTPTPPTMNFRATTYTFGYFFAVGVGDTASTNVYYSTDMVTWIPAASPGTAIATNGLNAVASNGTTMVGVGNNGTISYSSDGSTWTAATFYNGGAGGHNLYGVAYSPAGAVVGGGAYWVAVGAAGTLMYSVDAVNWYPSTGTSPAPTQDLYAVTALPALPTTYVPGWVANPMVVAVGAAGTVITSPDGNNWTQQALPGAVTPRLNAVVSDGVQFLAVGQAGATFVSTNGTTWTNPVTTYFSSPTGSGVASTTATTGQDLYSLYGTSTLYVATGQGGVAVTSQ